MNVSSEAEDDYRSCEVPDPHSSKFRGKVVAQMKGLVVTYIIFNVELHTYNCMI